MATEYQEGEEKHENTFNFGEYQITTSPHDQEVTIPETGDTFTIKIKDLSWARRNQILSKSIRIATDGNTTFDGDAYVRSCLKEMVVDAPWGRTTESFLMSIDARLGGVLETLVPQAFDASSSLSEVDDVKKG